MDFNPRVLVAAAIAILALCAVAAIALGIVKVVRARQGSLEASPSVRHADGSKRHGEPSAGPTGAAAANPQRADGDSTSAGSSSPRGQTGETGSAAAPAPTAASGGGATSPDGGTPETPAATSGGAAGVGPAGASPDTSLSGAAAADTLPDGSSDAARAAPVEPVASPTANLTLRVIPFHPIRFDLLCNGKPYHSGVLAVGVPLIFECPGVYEVSLEDAGAVSLTVNGDRVYLGRPGQSLAGRHISAANYKDFTNAPLEAVPQ